MVFLYFLYIHVLDKSLNTNTNPNGICLYFSVSHYFEFTALQLVT